jgi:hypothetical protein
MKQLRNHGKDPTSGRHLLSLGVSALPDLAGALDLPSQHFIALVACDAALASVDEMSEASAWLLTQGAVVIATWGPGCERFHDIIDETGLDINPAETDETVVLTTWHDADSLAEAVWFVVNTIAPAPAYQGTCNTVVGISVGNTAWQTEIEDWLAKPDRLSQAVLSASGTSGGA